MSPSTSSGTNPNGTHSDGFFSSEGRLLLTDEQFWSRVSRNPDGCWEWRRARISSGYGNFGGSTDGRRWMKLAHRHAWEITNGPIPLGMVVLHRCDNPPCVRPDHLSLGTMRDNTADMIQKGRWVSNGFASRTHCKRGHLFTAENTRVTSAGWRHCRACQRERPQPGKVT